MKRVIGEGGTHVFQYDRKGNTIQAFGRKLSFYSFNRAKSVDMDTPTSPSIEHVGLSMFYDSKNSLLERRDSLLTRSLNGSFWMNSSTIFIGSLFEQVTTPNGTIVNRLCILFLSSHVLLFFPTLLSNTLCFF